MSACFSFFNKENIISLGESQTISLRKMVSIIEKALGKKAKMSKKTMQSGDVDRTYSDISKGKMY